GSKIIPGNYWINSTSSNALLSYVGFLSENATGKMQSLMDGDNIETTINDSMNYDTLSKHEERDFYSLLVHTGYLTSPDYRVEEVPGNRPKKIYSLRIPNLEIKECFEANILEHFQEVSTQGENKALHIAQSLLEGNCDRASDNIYDLLQIYVSVRDFATKAKPENFYHGFLSGVFTNCGSFITDFKSNSESGDGYADITFFSKNGSTVVIMEIKVSDSDELFERDALNALKQIEEKNYTGLYLNKHRIKNIYVYGISFCKKDCYIEMKKIK
ncbi:MAG: PD-(D/E)XK nuclease domain-containing protein, partial [Succinivibrionaceae bacterium]